jgi:hypothetical protein
MSSTDSKKFKGPAAATAINNVISGDLAWSSWIRRSEMKTFTWHLDDQSVPLVLLVQWVLEFLQVLSTTSVAIADMHLRVFTSHDLDLQLFRLQTHEDDVALSCTPTVDFLFPGTNMSALRALARKV